MEQFHQASPGTYPPWQPPPGHNDQAYRAVLARLYSLGQGRMLPGRERLRTVLARAGDPHLAVPSILVGGTNGKGRCVAALSAVLTASGLRTGAFLKPHLVSVRERWRIDDQKVEVGLFPAVATTALDLIDLHRQETGAEISFFEANVLIGALLFRATCCDIALWEVGLGGKEDACNLVDPLLSILTNVGYDHQALLGDTLTEIAEDKAQIARPGRTLLLGPPRPGWEEAFREYAPIVRQHCAAVGARLVELAAPNATAWQAHLADGGMGLPPDTAELRKAALTERGVSRLLEQAGSAAGGPLPLGTIHYPGRMERRILGGLDLSAIPGAEHIGTVRPAPVLLDAAHNVDSLQWLAQVLGARAAGPPESPTECGPLEQAGEPPAQRYPFLFGCQASRDPAEMLAPLAPHISGLVPIEVPVLRPCPLADVVAAAQRLRIPVSLPPGLELDSVPSDYPIGHMTELDPPDNTTRWLDCTAHALGLATPVAPLVICGSIYNLGEILRVFSPAQ